MCSDGPSDQRQRLASARRPPMMGNEIRIVRDDGTTCEPGEIGEIIIRSPTVMSGYWNKNVLTAEIVRDGWMHTQDLGFAGRE